MHRIGRAGRAGRKGKAITLFTETDVSLLRGVANVMKLSGCSVPDWIMGMKKLDKGRRKKLQKFAPTRKRISTTSTFDKSHGKGSMKRKRMKKERAKKRRKEGGKNS